MRRRGTSSISVSVDVDVYLDDIEDDDIKAEYERRAIGPTGGDGAAMDLIREAHEELLRGRPNHALALIERALFPTLIDPRGTSLMQLPQTRLELPSA